MPAGRVVRATPQGLATPMTGQRARIMTCVLRGSCLLATFPARPTCPSTTPACSPSACRCSIWRPMRLCWPSPAAGSLPLCTYALLPAFLALLSPPHPCLQLFLLFVVQAHNPLPAQYTSGSLLQSALRSAMKPVAAAKRAMARVASRAARGRHGGQAADTAAASAADKAGEQQAAATAVVDKAAERQAAAQKAAAGQRREVRLDVAHDPEKVVADLPMKSHLVKAGPCC